MKGDNSTKAGAERRRMVRELKLLRPVARAVLRIADNGITPDLVSNRTLNDSLGQVWLKAIRNSQQVAKERGEP